MPDSFLQIHLYDGIRLSKDLLSWGDGGLKWDKYLHTPNIRVHSKEGLKERILKYIEKN